MNDITTQQPVLRSGPSYLMQGFRMIREPGIRLFVAIPLLINLVIFGGLMSFTLGRFDHYISQLMDWLPSWLDFLQWILWPIAVILLLAIVMYLFSTIANLIAAPFNGLLAEKVEERITGKEVTARETIAQAVASFPRSIARELRKLMYYAKYAIAVLVLTLIFPPLSGIAWFLLGAWMLALEYCDYAMDNNKLSFAESKRRLKANRGVCGSFGALVMLGTMIPILNLFIMPAAVCGGTQLWVERLKKV